MTMTTTPRSGLEGVVVADTELSDVDGERGRLILRGHDVESLAGRATFEDACALFFDGALPSAAQRASLVAALGAARARAFEHLPRLGDALRRDDVMDALRAAVAHVASTSDARTTALDLTGAMATFAAAWWQTRQGAAPIAPDPASPHAADFLRMVVGEPGKKAAARAAGLDAYWVTVVDHGLNASTFAARVVASTASDTVSAVVAALGALKGPLHGGAPGPVLDMLDAVSSAERADAWLQSELAAGRRIMGMGHRIYRVRDPRAAVLERAIVALESSAGAIGRLPLARAVESAAERILRARHPDRPLKANVEFYTAVLLDALGLPRQLFTATFAASRVVGWCAHVAEQRASGRLIRPASRYVGVVHQNGSIPTG